MTNEKINVIFDTNVWISFLIGKKLRSINNYIVDGRITIITSEQLLIELKATTSSDKLKKYFPTESVNDLLELMEVICKKVQIHSRHKFCRDPKDNFLFDLIDFSKADYLVTGDKDLLEHNPFKTAQILTAKEFEKQIAENHF